MLFLPVAERELRERARKIGTYSLRMFVALIAILFLVGLLSFHSSSGLPAAGREIFKTFAVLITLFCLFQGALQTGDCLSEETREGTLGLLFLADLGVHDIVAGKLVSASLNSLYGLLAVFPVVAISLLMGGVTGGEIWRTTLALVNALWFSLAAGLAVSARSRAQLKSWSGAIALVTLCVIGPYAAGELISGGGLKYVGAISPLQTTLLAQEPAFSKAPLEYWLSLLVVHVLAWIFILSACQSVRHGWRDQPEVDEKRRGQRLPKFVANHRTVGRRAHSLRQLLEHNPVAWLGVRSARAPWLIYIGTAVIVAGMTLFLYQDPTHGSRVTLPPVAECLALVAGFNLFIKLFVAAAACHVLSAARRDGVLDLLMTTPLSASKIVEGHANAVRRIFVPAIGLWLAIAASFPVVAAACGLEEPSVGVGLSLIILLFELFFVVELHALGWVGLWFGLTSRKTHLAVGRTIFLVLGIPWLIVWIPIIGILFMLASPLWNLGLIRWARNRLHEHLRNVRSEHWTEIANESWWRPLWDMLPPRRGSKA